MQKDAISLVEVLISVMLISVVITSILQIKENNLHFLVKTNEMYKNNMYVSTLAIDKSIKDGNTYLKDKLDFNDDDIRKSLKNIKIDVKNKEQEPLVFITDEYSLIINIKSVNLKLNDTYEKQFYRFSLANSQ